MSGLVSGGPPQEDPLGQRHVRAGKYRGFVSSVPSGSLRGAFGVFSL